MTRPEGIKLTLKTGLLDECKATHNVKVKSYQTCAQRSLKPRKISSITHKVNTIRGEQEEEVTGKVKWTTHNFSEPDVIYFLFKVV